MDMSLSKLQEMVKDREPWHVAVNGVKNRWTQLSIRTTTGLLARLSILVPHIDKVCLITLSLGFSACRPASTHLWQDQILQSFSLALCSSNIVGERMTWEIDTYIQEWPQWEHFFPWPLHLTIVCNLSFLYTLETNPRKLWSFPVFKI